MRRFLKSRRLRYLLALHDLLVSAGRVRQLDQGGVNDGLYDDAVLTKCQYANLAGFLQAMILRITRSLLVERLQLAAGKRKRLHEREPLDYLECVETAWPIWQVSGLIG